MKLVPTKVFGPILLKILEGYESIDDGLAILSEKTGYATDTIWTVAHERRAGCEFDLADKLLCASGNVDLWRREPLSDIYYAIDLSTSVCAAEGCTREFVPKTTGQRMQLYCSKTCKNAAVKMNLGITHKRIRTDLKPVDSCWRGHEFTEENTIARSDGSGRQCRKCYNKAQRENRARKRAARKVAAA